MFCDSLRKKMEGVTIPNAVTIRFGIEMPASWSRKKKLSMRGQPHQQKPDIDNLQKSVLDALLPDDSVVHSITATKVWDLAGWIRIEDFERG
jgi:Holliday junction resolvase RusA-like endonuclease